MTITNHIRTIEDIANNVILAVDDRKYGTAHMLLDTIEKRARLAHEHIDQLQNIQDRPVDGKGGK